LPKSWKAPPCKDHYFAPLEQLQAKTVEAPGVLTTAAFSSARSSSSTQASSASFDAWSVTFATSHEVFHSVSPLLYDSCSRRARSIRLRACTNSRRARLTRSSANALFQVRPVVMGNCWRSFSCFTRSDIFAAAPACLYDWRSRRARLTRSSANALPSVKPGVVGMCRCSFCFSSRSDILGARFGKTSRRARPGVDPAHT